MIFRVTHIDPAGHRRKARVSAPDAWHAIDQMDRVFGAARAAASVRMDTGQVLRLVAGTPGRGIS